MEGKKGSSFSLTTELFGSKESTQPSASTGIFASIFPPPSKVLGRNSNSEVTGSWQKQHSGNQEWSNKKETPGMPTKDRRSSIFQEERAEPCHLSSSLYYGGQDVYSQSSSTQSSASYPIFKKDGEEDVQNGSSASRGNWWQGSLYY